MGRVKIVRAAERPRLTGADFLKGKAEGPFSEQVLAARGWPYFPADGEQLWLWEFEIDAGYRARVHAHDHDEILLVLDGELRLGSQRCGPGDAIYVPKNTLYSEISDTGARFLVFRGEPVTALIPKDEFLAARGARADED